MSINPTVIPQYYPSSHVQAANARQDRLLLRVGGWRVGGTDAAFQTFREDLVGVQQGPSGLFQMFGAPQTPYGNLNTLKFPIWRGRQSADLAVLAPLFGGNITFRRQMNEGLNWWFGTAELALNPTTWVMHQPTTLWRTSPEGWLNIPPVMFSSGAELYNVWEKLLVGQNNVVMGTPRHVALAGPDVWQIQIRRFLEGVLSALDAAIGGASDAAGMSFPSPSRDMKLKVVETYWEQWSTAPLAEMARLEKSFRRVASRSTITWRQIEPEAASVLLPDGQIDVGTEENSPRIGVRLATGVDCSIYAKTTKRIRFEVIHHVQDARTAFPSSSATSIGALMALLDRAANDAAFKFNSIWSWAQPLGNIAATARGLPHELVASVFLAIDPLMASDIVDALVANGRVVVGPGGSLRAPVQALKRRGVLRSAGRVGQDRVWVVADHYQAALDTLRSTY